MKKVLIVDDEEELRLIVREVLEIDGYSPLEAADGRSAVKVIQEQSLDAVILDLNMPGAGGIETLKEIKRITPRLPVIILTGHGDIPLAVMATKLGAYDFITKPPDFSNLRAIIREATEIPCNCGLTLRERETLKWVGEGKSNFEIAVLMGLSENTIRTHLKKVFAKLGVYSRAQAVAAAFESGILQSIHAADLAKIGHRPDFGMSVLTDTVTSKDIYP